MKTNLADDACPFEWAEFNIPAELLQLPSGASPFARRVFALKHRSSNSGPVWRKGAFATTASSGVGVLLMPGLGLGSSPKL
jgi:hypothetical protein